MDIEREVGAEQLQIVTAKPRRCSRQREEEEEDETHRKQFYYEHKHFPRTKLNIIEDYLNLN